LGPHSLFSCAQGKITKNVEREILNHSILIHPHVVRFEECFLTEKYLAIAMEYAAGGNMYSHVTAKCALAYTSFNAEWPLPGPM
jgi:serine/threonine protein kinase